MLLNNLQVLHIVVLDVTQTPQVWVCKDCAYQREVTGKLLHPGEPLAVHMGTQGGLQFGRLEIIENAPNPEPPTGQP